MPEPTARRVGLVAALAAALLWSTSYAATAALLDRVPPLTIGALRFTLAAVVLALLVRRQPSWCPPGAAVALRLGAPGLLGITAYFVLENVGVEWAGAADAAVLVASYPVLAALVEVAVLRQRPQANVLLGGVLAVLGVLVLVGPREQGHGEHRLAGDALLLLAGVVFAVYNVVVRRQSGQASPLTLTYYQTCTGALAFVLLAPLEIGRWEAPALQDVLLVVHLGLACSLLAFVLWARALRAIPSGSAVTVLNVVPAAGLGFAVLVGERVSPEQVAGAGIIIAGVLIGLREGQRRRGNSTTSRSDSACTAGKTGAASVANTETSSP